ncbi:hypothetical protein [Fulvivirga ligni]|uniref:hypothetical protein n=1 Tax=Fulvivirga ligni TaxID=2904246 RepID=UPI001F489860|nr:hypothetical protein [Fulvivirga ligni]UII19030.1 hypothetical protein LVD16_14390 [Fulvivirga ligni]
MMSQLNFTKTSLLLFYCCMLFLLFSHCSEQNHEEPNDGDIVFENLDKLETDTLFLKFVNQLVTNAENINDYIGAYELSERESSLSEDEKLELALALGYGSIETMNDSEQELWDSWINIVERFGLITQERELASQIFSELILEIKTNNNNSGKILRPDREEYCSDQSNRCYQNLFNRAIITADELCEYIPNLGIVSCIPIPPDNIFPEWERLGLVGCDFQYDCCIIGYDSNDCMRMF